MKLKKRALSACVASIFALPMISVAATDTANLTVQIVIAGTCAVSDDTLDFLSHPDLTGPNIDVIGKFDLNCSTGLPYSVGLGDGVNPTGTQRRMRRASTGDYINYALFRDAGLSNTWRDSGADVLSGNGGGTVQIPVYGRVPGSQGSPTVGTYTDTVLITVTF